jgi:hypothetical protein
VRVLNQPVEWSIHFLFFSGICFIFYKMGRKKIAQPKTTVTEIINTKHDIDFGDDDYEEEYVPNAASKKMTIGTLMT